jgi:hypothetical protein
MNRFGILSLLALGLLLSWSGCRIGSLDDPIIVADVEKEFYIDLWEELRPEGRNFVLVIKTIKEQECLNYHIDYDIERQGLHVRLSINEIIEPEDCNPGQAVATEKAVAGLLAPRNYDISIDLKNTAFNDGRLTVSGDRYQLDLETEKGIILVREELLRIPDNTIWGYAAYQQTDDEGKADSFLSDLGEIADKPSYLNGYYGYFTLVQNGQTVYLNNPPQTERIKPFIFHYDGPASNMLSLLEEYRNAYGDALNLKVFNTKGEEW